MKKLKEDGIEKKILILWVISNKTNSNKKNRPNIKEKKIEGLRWKFEGLSMKNKEKREKKKKKDCRHQIKDSLTRRIAWGWIRH